MAKYIIGTVEEIPPGSRKIVEVAGRSIGVFNINGEYFALLNRCPHQAGPLCVGNTHGFLRSGAVGEYAYSRPGEILRCPWHGWEFDVRTGQSWFDPAQVRVRRYDVRVEPGSALRDDAGVAPAGAGSEPAAQGAGAGQAGAGQAGAGQAGAGQAGAGQAGAGQAGAGQAGAGQAGAGGAAAATQAVPAEGAAATPAPPGCPAGDASAPPPPVPGTTPADVAASVSEGERAAETEPGMEGMLKGPYVAETYPVSVEQEYLVVEIGR